jgi:hypothetical protein
LNHASLVASSSVALDELAPVSFIQQHWKDADNHKLTQLLKIDPHDHSKANIQKLHENWPNKPYKSFATLVRGKLEKICAGEAIAAETMATKEAQDSDLCNRTFLNV